MSRKKKNRKHHTSKTSTPVMTSQPQQPEQEQPPQTQSARQPEEKTPPPPTPAKQPALRPNGTRPLWTISLGSLLALDLPPREHLIAPWLRQGESAMIYAPTGVGKSLFALSLALAIAGGGEYLNWNAPKQRTVLYVDGEMPIDDIKDRAAMLLPSVGGDPEAASENMIFMARQYQDRNADMEFPDLATEQGRDAILRMALEQGAELVILDNLSTLATIDDENSASAFNAPVAFLLKMKQAGLACILIHHAGKGNSGTYRGSSKIATTFEVIIGLSKHSDPLMNNDVDKTTFRLSWDKYRGKRDASTGMALDVVLESHGAMTEDGQLQARWSSEAAVDQQIETLIAMGKSGEYKSQKELAAAMGCSQSAISKLLMKAIAKGVITKMAWAGYMNRAKSNDSLGDEDASPFPIEAGTDENPDF